jgi:hypothetical protein
MDTQPARPPAIVSDGSSRKVYYRLGALLLSFALGALSVFVVRYLFSGKGLQLAPDVFISLVFTVALGAASMVLALLAINFGRISERVITERADRSIEIQMSLFEKSLDLQTRLFDKTMSTLESIGRSTGVTEQRLGDMVSMFQNPAFMKQVAGRAVEETASELGKKAKEGVVDTQTETQLAEKLTQNIVRELSARFEGLERAVRGPSAQPLATSTFQAGTIPTFGTSYRNFQIEEPAETPEDTELKRRYKERTALARKVIGSIPEAAVRPVPSSIKFWDFLFAYKGKDFAMDTRLSPASQVSALDESIKNLVIHPVDCLIFAFVSPPGEGLTQQLEQRNRVVGGRVRIVVGDDESTLHNELLGILESVAAALPSTE